MKKIKIVIVIRWVNGDDDEDKYHSISSSVVCSGIYPHHSFIRLPVS